MNIELVRAKNTEEDIKALLDIERTTMGSETYHGYFTEEEVIAYINREVVYIIKKDNIAIGNVAYQIKDRGYAYIGGLIIKPEFQKQGFAKEAMRKLMEELKDYKKIDLITHPDNIAAIRIYESFGFIIVERKENYFGDGEPRIRMVLEK